MNDPKDMERLAAVEHESWAKWARWMLGELDKESGGDFNINSLDCVQRWRRQAQTRYSDLSKKEKESDRDVVREKLPYYRPDDVPTFGGVSRRG